MCSFSHFCPGWVSFWVCLSWMSSSGCFLNNRVRKFVLSFVFLRTGGLGLKVQWYSCWPFNMRHYWQTQWQVLLLAGAGWWMWSLLWRVVFPLSDAQAPGRKLVALNVSLWWLLGCERFLGLFFLYLVGKCFCDEGSLNNWSQLWLFLRKVGLLLNQFSKVHTKVSKSGFKFSV